MGGGSEQKADKRDCVGRDGKRDEVDQASIDGRHDIFVGYRTIFTAVFVLCQGVQFAVGQLLEVERRSHDERGLTDRWAIELAWSLRARW